MNLTASVSERIQMPFTLQIEDPRHFFAGGFNLTASAFIAACFWPCPGLSSGVSERLSAALMLRGGLETASHFQKCDAVL
ncbi:hypothetical protein JW906_01285 [bacterium]|nr:hypothetical protein [bacterium]